MQRTIVYCLMQQTIVYSLMQQTIVYYLMQQTIVYCLMQQTIVYWLVQRCYSLKTRNSFKSFSATHCIMRKKHWKDSEGSLCNKSFIGQKPPSESSLFPSPRWVSPVSRATPVHIYSPIIANTDGVKSKYEVRISFSDFLYLEVLKYNF